jgi:hypothetical protein
LEKFVPELEPAEAVVWRSKQTGQSPCGASASIVAPQLGQIRVVFMQLFPPANRSNRDERLQENSRGGRDLPRDY